MNVNKNQHNGFTIVELLIVIVVIGILAAIVIVAYNNIQQRANASASQTAAAAALKKAEVYNTEIGSYPTAPSQLTGAAGNVSYQLKGTTFAATVTTTTSNQTLMFISCGSTVGVKIGYWFDTANAIQYYYGGTANATNCTGTTGQTN